MSNKKTDQNTTIQELKDRFDRFASERNWVNLDLKDLLLSAFIELGELSEHFQWLKDTEEVDKKEASEELVDVFNYLIRLMIQLDIDLTQAFYNKMDKLDKKYPVAEMKDCSRDDYFRKKEEYRLMISYK